MNISGAAVLAGVAGDPIAHSLSPLLHNSWIAAAGLDAAYVPFHVSPAAAPSAFRALGALGITGVNVTLPLKTIALDVADMRSTAADLVGAANVLLTMPDGLLADNTDVVGFTAGLGDAAASTAGRVLLLGAGGAARAVVVALMGRADRLTILTRRLEAAQALAAFAADLGLTADAQPWLSHPALLADADLVVNATSLGMKGQPPLALMWPPAASGAVAYDLVYTPQHTRFLIDAAAAGWRTRGGLGMLIGQARPSFEMFFGRPPPAGVDAEVLLRARLEAQP